MARDGLQSCDTPLVTQFEKGFEVVPKAHVSLHQDYSLQTNWRNTSKSERRDRGWDWERPVDQKIRQK